MSKIVVIDFDHTLFNATAFQKDVKKTLRKLGIGEDVFTKTYQEIYDLHGYNLFLHLMKLAAEYKLDIMKAKQETDRIINRLGMYLHLDTKSFLNDIKEKGHFSIIYTFGNQIFQKQKIDTCQLDSMVDDVQITPDDCKMDLFRNRYNLNVDNITFIDDNPYVLDKVKREFPSVDLVRIQREDDDRFANISLDDVLTVKSLSEIRI